MNEHEKFSLWLSGFTDGEGCFSVSCRYLKRNTLGIEIGASFSIGQKVTPGHLALLSKIKKHLKTGGIRIDDNCYKYETRKLKEIVKYIIPFFQKYPLITDKKKDFIIFAEVCSRIKKKQHLNKSGLIDILNILRLMNSSGKRRNSIDGLIASLTTKNVEIIPLEEKKEIKKIFF